MDKIVFVISPHGFGHLTRQIALKDTLLQLRDDLRITMVISEYHEEVFTNSICNSDRVQIEVLPITPKITMESWDQVDLDSTRESFLRFWEWETQIRDDMEWGRILMNADLIINDIESVHNPIASKMRIPIVNISNFTWSDILDGLGLSDLAQNYVKWESLGDLNLKLPFSSKCLGFPSSTSVGLLCRPIDWDKVKEIQSRIDQKSVLINYTHPDTDLDLMVYAEILASYGFKIMMAKRYYRDTGKFEPMFIDQEGDQTQNYYAAADVVVAKVGYGTVSEVMCGGTPLCFWTRENYREDTLLAQAITDRHMGEEIPTEITPQELVKLCKKWTTVNINPKPNHNEAIAELVLEQLEKSQKP